MSKELNKFEKARILSARALELSHGDKPKVKIPKEMKGKVLSKDYVKIAEEEFEKGLLDLELYSNE